MDQDIHLDLLFRVVFGCSRKTFLKYSHEQLIVSENMKTNTAAPDLFINYFDGHVVKRFSILILSHVTLKVF